jgi:hypothetical protein
MEQFNTEMAKLRKEYNYHQLEWMAHLRKILTLEKFSVDAKAWICFLFPNGKSTN